MVSAATATPTETIGRAVLVRYRLEGVEFPGANLIDTRLDGVKLIGADLKGANLIKGNLTGADLTGDSLPGVNLIEAKLRRASLREADLSRSDLSDATFYNADMEGAVLDDTIVKGTDLTTARNLTTEQLDRACEVAEPAVTEAASTPRSCGAVPSADDERQLRKCK